MRLNLETSKKFLKTVLAWFPVILLSSIILYQSTKPWPYIIKNLAHYDKAIHALIYFFLAIFATRAFLFGKKEVCLCHFIFAWIFTSIFGAIDETIQNHFTYRQADFLDWLADMAGASLGIILYWYWSFRSKKRASKNHPNFSPS